MPSFTVSLNKPRLIAKMETLAAGQLKKRAERLGVQGVKQVKAWIDSELGPSTGSSAKRGMVSMRDLDWDFRIINAGKLPVTVEIFCDDITGATAAKFWSLNSGHRKFKQEGMFKFTGEKAAAEGDKVVTETDEPKTEGHEWVDRLQAVLVARAQARAI
jgi:hypothetical protein